MNDHAVLVHINELAAREHELRQAVAKRPLTDDEKAELDPDAAEVRESDTVEKYRQQRSAAIRRAARRARRAGSSPNVRGRSDP